MASTLQDLYKLNEKKFPFQARLTGDPYAVFTVFGISLQTDVSENFICQRRGEGPKCFYSTEAEWEEYIPPEEMETYYAWSVCHSEDTIINIFSVMAPSEEKLRDMCPYILPSSKVFRIDSIFVQIPKRKVL